MINLLIGLAPMGLALIACKATRCRVLLALLTLTWYGYWMLN